MINNKKTLYFMCTGNSCRSQIAEGFAKYYGNENFEIYSGGIEAHGLNLRAVKVMSEIGIDILKQPSDLINEDILFKSDYVITLCGDSRDKCPVLPPSIKNIHCGLEDPAKATGTEEEILNKFREVRDIIKENVRNLIENI